MVPRRRMNLGAVSHSAGKKAHVKSLGNSRSILPPRQVEAPQRASAGQVDAFKVHEGPLPAAEENPLPLPDALRRREEQQRLHHHCQRRHDGVERDALPLEDGPAVKGCQHGAEGSERGQDADERPYFESPLPKLDGSDFVHRRRFSCMERMFKSRVEGDGEGEGEGGTSPQTEKV